MMNLVLTWGMQAFSWIETIMVKAWSGASYASPGSTTAYSNGSASMRWLFGVSRSGLAEGGGGGWTG
jgi:hypothetical protein